MPDAPDWLRPGGFMEPAAVAAEFGVSPYDVRGYAKAGYIRSHQVSRAEADRFGLHTRTRHVYCRTDVMELAKVMKRIEGKPSLRKLRSLAQPRYGQPECPTCRRPYLPQGDPAADAPAAEPITP